VPPRRGIGIALERSRRDDRGLIPALAGESSKAGQVHEGDRWRTERGRALSSGHPEQTRLAASGLTEVDERDTSTCCYAKQDKFWVQGAPNGERWEIYTVLADSPTFFGAGSTCCAGSSTSANELETAAACC
jgi:hypothetical protein